MGAEQQPPSGSRSLKSSTAGFTGANVFNKGPAHMLWGLIVTRGLLIGPQNQDVSSGVMMETCLFSITTD